MSHHRSKTSLGILESLVPVIGIAKRSLPGRQVLKVKKQKMIYRTHWAELLERVLIYDVLNCDHCGNQLTLIAIITTSPTACAKILEHLKIDRQEFEVIKA